MKKLGAIAVVTSAVVLGSGARPCGAQGFDPLERPTPASPFETAPLSWDGPREDGRRTLAGFPRNLGRNLVGVFSGRNLLPLAIGTAATASASAFDTRSERLLRGICEPCGTTGATVGGSAAMVPLVGGLFLAGRLAPQGRFRAASYDFAQAAIITGAYTSLLKHGVARQRPDGADRLSFPSGHASTAFSLAAVADRHYGWKVGVPAYVLASGIGLSRVESNRHRLSDVVAGATLGVIVGRTVTRLDGGRAGGKRLLSVGPATDPQGRGVGLGFSASW